MSTNILRKPIFIKVGSLEENKSRDFGLNMIVRIEGHINMIKNTRPDKTEQCLLDGLCGDETGTIVVRIRGNEFCDRCSVGNTVVLRNALLKQDKSGHARLELDRFSKVEVSETRIEQVDLSRNLSETMVEKREESQEEGPEGPEGLRIQDKREKIQEADTKVGGVNKNKYMNKNIRQKVNENYDYRRGNAREREIKHNQENNQHDQQEQNGQNYQSYHKNRTDQYQGNELQLQQQKDGRNKYQQFQERQNLPDQEQRYGRQENRDYYHNGGLNQNGYRRQ